jgi:rhamnosyltransferase
MVKALIVAHYHPQGKVREDTLELLDKLNTFYEKIIFISTCLDSAQANRLPKNIEVLVRENYGYDFYSYRQGIMQLYSTYGVWSNLTELALMNTSFLCVKSNVLMEQFFAKDVGANVCLGLTKSTAIDEHVQSYLLRFGSDILGDKRFLDWWDRMVPLSDRQQVINQYEIGLSQQLSSFGHRLEATYHHWNFIPDALRKKFLYCDEQMLYQINLKFGALHYHWNNLFNQYGVIKIEVLKSNPEKVNLKPLNIAINNSQTLLKYVTEGLSN